MKYSFLKNKDILFGNINPLESPRTQVVHIEFTSKCNLRCIYCAVSQPSYIGTDIDSKLLSDIIGTLKRRHVQTVVVSGHGETTILNDWHLYCKKLLRNNMKLQIISNFSKELSNEEIKTLSQFRTIEISIDTADPKLFKKLRRGADLKTLCLNMAKVKAEAIKEKIELPSFIWSCVVSNKTIFGLKELVSLGIAMGVKIFHFCNLTKYPDVEDALHVKHISEMPVVTRRKAKDALTEIFTFLKHSNIEYFCQAGLIDSLNQSLAPPNFTQSQTITNLKVRSRIKKYWAPNKTRKTKDCIDPWSFLFIQSNKKIQPCCWHRSIGSLDKDLTLSELANNSQIKKLRKSLLTGKLHKDCFECPVREWTTIKTLNEKVKMYLES